MFVTLVSILVAGLSAGGSSPSTELRVTFIGNMAFHLTDGTVALLTDFPYESGAFGYMDWSKSSVPTGPAPICVISHSHADHFSPKLAREFCGRIVGPNDVVEASGVEVLELKPEARWEGLTITAFPTPHGSLEHYSFLIEWRGKRLYLTGDTEDTGPLLAARNLDVAFVSPWLLEAIQKNGGHIDAHQVVVYHHRNGEAVPKIQNRILPTQGQVLSLGKR